MLVVGERASFWEILGFVMCQTAVWVAGGETRQNVITYIQFKNLGLGGNDRNKPGQLTLPLETGGHAHSLHG